MVDSTCEKCRTAPGTPHAFHYGRKAGIPALGDPPPYRSATIGNMHATWTEHYEIGGVDSAVLCDDCLRKARIRRSARLLTHQWLGVPLVTVLYVLWAVGVATWLWQANWVQLALWAGVGLGATVIAYSVIYLMQENEDFAQRAAVELHADRLHAEGWNAFWTDREFLGLTPH